MWRCWSTAQTLGLYLNQFPLSHPSDDCCVIFFFFKLSEPLPVRSLARVPPEPKEEIKAKRLDLRMCPYFESAARFSQLGIHCDHNHQARAPSRGAMLYFFLFYFFEVLCQRDNYWKRRLFQSNDDHTSAVCQSGHIVTDRHCWRSTRV